MKTTQRFRGHLSVGLVAGTLAAMMAVCVLALATPAAAANGQVLCSSAGYGCAGGGYDGHDSWGYWRSGSTNAYGPHNCTAYAAYRADKNGAPNPGNLGDAAMWATNARAKGIPVDGTPAVGAIAQFNSGHVAYVDEVGPGYVITSDDNYLYNVTTRQRRTQASGWPDNFIHFKAVSGGPVIGAVLTNGAFVVKEGISGGWVTETTNVRSAVIANDSGGPVIGAVLTDGTFVVKQGISGGWVTETTGVNTATIASGSGGPVIGAVLTSGAFVVKQGISGGWVTETTNVATVAIS